MADRYIPEHRRTQFKAKSTFKPEELRRRREEAQVEIRKAKREENLAKRRGIGTGENRPGASLGAAPDSDDENPPSESQVCFFFCFSCRKNNMLSPVIPSPLRSPELQLLGAPTPLVPRRSVVVISVRRGRIWHPPPSQHCTAAIQR
jgi:hypothetical protein